MRFDRLLLMMFIFLSVAALVLGASNFNNGVNIQGKLNVTNSNISITNGNLTISTGNITGVHNIVFENGFCVGTC